MDSWSSIQQSANRGRSQRSASAFELAGGYREDDIDSGQILLLNHTAGSNAKLYRTFIASSNFPHQCLIRKNCIDGRVVSSTVLAFSRVEQIRRIGMPLEGSCCRLEMQAAAALATVTFSPGMRPGGLASPRVDGMIVYSVCV